MKDASLSQAITKTPNKRNVILNIFFEFRFFQSKSTGLRPQKNIYLFPAYRVTKKKIQPGGRKKNFFSYFSEDLALPISFIQPIIANFQYTVSKKVSNNKARWIKRFFNIYKTRHIKRNYCVFKLFFCHVDFVFAVCFYV